jgi:hypothetical protein
MTMSPFAIGDGVTRIGGTHVGGAGAAVNQVVAAHTVNGVDDV